MDRLRDLATLIRSKNAGPFHLTFDVILPDLETFDRVRTSGVLTAERIGELYKTDPAHVLVIPYDAANAIKVTIPRPVVQGDLLDGDVQGGLQFVPLADVEIPNRA